MNMEQQTQQRQQLMQITSLDKMCLQMITLLCESMPFSALSSSSSSFSISSRCSYLEFVCIRRLNFVWAFIHAPTQPDTFAMESNLIQLTLAHAHKSIRRVPYAHSNSDYVCESMQYYLGVERTWQKRRLN